MDTGGRLLLLSYYYIEEEAVKIDILNFETYEDLACKIADDFDAITDEAKNVSVIAKYKDARRILAELICLGYQIGQIHSFEDPDCDGYCDEYIISLSDLDRASVWCEPFMREGKYIYDDSVVAYVFDDCNSKCLKKMTNKIAYSVSVGCEDECDCENCNLDTNNSESTYIARTEDGKIAGFTKTWSTYENGTSCYSSYSHYNDDEDMVKNIARGFGINI